MSKISNNKCKIYFSRTAEPEDKDSNKSFFSRFIKNCEIFLLRKRLLKRWSDLSEKLLTITLANDITRVLVLKH
jgi:hypothetical protein